jgi:NAD(P)-dependent dehydrogenase (short-subunit alcohol dehydrogenase family)
MRVEDLMSDFKGRTALVTGGGRNIGRAISLAFADEGANVGIIVNSSKAEAEAVAREVEARGVRAAVTVGNVGDAASCERMVNEITGALGPIDYLVNNAARRPRQEFLDISVDDWDSIISSNLSSVFYMTRLVLPNMVERKFGRIINIGGPDGVRGMRLRAHNVTCKAGLIGLTKAVALEFGIHGITANLVIPGITATSRVEKDYPEHEKLVAGLRAAQERSEISIPREGQPEEIARGVIFFASEKSSFMTSQSLYVTGGLFGLP